VLCDFETSVTFATFVTFVPPLHFLKEPTMKLYYSPGACSLAAHIMIRELGIDSELEAVDLKTHRTQSGRDFYQINPKGYVPVLDRGEKEGLLTEAPAVLLYLTELKRHPQHDRYRLLEWLAFT
jgi:glutathione S-transferase